MTSAPEQTTSYRFTLFVVGNEVNSVTAEENLRDICAEHLLKGACTITIVDVAKDYQAALDNNILVAPTLLVEGPRGRSTILGNLSDIDSVIVTLRCNR